MIPSSPPPRFEDLVRSLLDGDPAVPRKLTEIERAMDHDTDLRREFLEQVELDALLSWELGEAQDGLLEERSRTVPFPEQRSRSVRLLLPLAAAASLALVFGAGFYFGYDPAAAAKTAPSAVAVLIEGEDCVWNLEDGREPGFGSAFSGGESLRIRSGVARLAMKNRAGLAIQGPAVVDLLSAEAVRVHEGQVSAYAPDEAIGFTLLTPGVEIVDLGTRFAANVERDGTTDVHVFEGEISVRETQTGKTGTASELLTSGHARRYGAKGGDRSEIAIAPEQFADPPDLEQLLASTGSQARKTPLDKPTPSMNSLSSGDLLAFQDFTKDEGELDGRLGGFGFSTNPWAANRSFTRIIPNVLSHSGDASAGGYLLVRGREKSEPFVANRLRRELASNLPAEFVFAIRASYHGLDGDDFFSLWIDRHGREDASHSDAPTLGIREGRFFARLDLEHSAAAGFVGDGETFVIAARHTRDSDGGNDRIELWLNPSLGAQPDAEATRPHRGPAAYRFLGVRMGKDTEVTDRLLVHAIAVATNLEVALESLDN